MTGVGELEVAREGLTPEGVSYRMGIRDDETF
jgi:hypothetical protein